MNAFLMEDYQVLVVTNCHGIHNEITRQIKLVEGACGRIRVVFAANTGVSGRRVNVLIMHNRDEIRKEIVNELTYVRARGCLEFNVVETKRGEFNE